MREWRDSNSAPPLSARPHNYLRRRATCATHSARHHASHDTCITMFHQVHFATTGARPHWRTGGIIPHASHGRAITPVGRDILIYGCLRLRRTAFRPRALHSASPRTCKGARSLHVCSPHSHLWPALNTLAAATFGLLELRSLLASARRPLATPGQPPRRRRSRRHHICWPSASHQPATHPAAVGPVYYDKMYGIQPLSSVKKFRLRTWQHY